MKQILALLIAGFVPFAFGNTERPLQVANADGWKFTRLPKDTFLEQFTGGAEASLTTGKTPDGAPAATVLVYKMDPAHARLAADVKAWHQFIFSKTATVKISVVTEKVIKVNGLWRYYIEFQSDSGTMLNTALMATVVEGQVQAFVYESARPTFLEMIPKVRDLMHDVELR